VCGWLAGWFVGCSHVSTVLALLCFALLRLLAFHSTCVAASKNKTKSKTKKKQ
jgi:hypothetical protein